MDEFDDPFAELLNSLKFDKRTHDDELVVTKAGDEIHRTHRALHDGGDELQCFVSRQTSKAVIDVLELVDIDHDKPKPLEMTLEQPILLVQDRVDVAPIVETSQLVDDRRVRQLFQPLCKSASIHRLEFAEYLHAVPFISDLQDRCLDVDSQSLSVFPLEENFLGLLPLAGLDAFLQRAPVETQVLAEDIGMNQDVVVAVPVQNFVRRITGNALRPLAPEDDLALSGRYVHAVRNSVQDSAQTLIKYSRIHHTLLIGKNRGARPTITRS